MSTFEDFTTGTRKLVDGKAKEKGYCKNGVDESKELFEFVHKMGLTHSEGEIVYKIVRYHNAGNKEDLLKAAGWLWLIYQHDARQVPDAK